MDLPPQFIQAAARLPHRQPASLGIDLVYLPRIESLYLRYGERFLDKVLTPGEKQFCQTPTSLKVKVTRIASRIAAKEAIFKALGIGLSTFGNAPGTIWRAVEVIRKEHKPPKVRLHDKASLAAQEQGIADWLISLTHDGDYAMAMVIGLQEPDQAMPD